MSILQNSIFISYRREDSIDITGRIYDWLIQEFGKNSVFKDVDSIPHGIDFKEYILKTVGQCRILLVVIGKQWLTVSDSKGVRLQNPEDLVVLEIRTALEKNIRVIPLLVHNISMPRASDLPDALKKLVYMNGMAIHPDPDFKSDLERLIQSIKTHLENIPEFSEKITEKKFTKDTNSFKISQDGRYRVLPSGIIQDTKTNLEWIVGPDEDTSWDEAKLWVDSLSPRYGIGWRMPTIQELSGIYEKGKGKCNIDTVFISPRKNLWVWSSKIDDSPSEWYFYFPNGTKYKFSCKSRLGYRAFAVL